MRIKLPSFPQLNKELIDTSKWSASPFKFFYLTPAGTTRALDLTHPLDDDDCWILEDIAGEWDPNTCALNVETDISLGSPSVLFGPNGVCPHDGTIGIGFQWYSKTSRQRGSQEGLTVKVSDPSQKKSIKLCFKPGQLRGDLSCDLIFYIAKEGDPRPDETHLANTSGYILGSPSTPSATLRLDGAGSIFPILAEKMGPRGPLWHLYCDWDEPEYDYFDESVNLILNLDHPAYPQINRLSPKFNPYLLIQILASCMTQVVMTLKDDESAWEKMLMGEDLFEGTVSQAVNYYIVALEWDTLDIVKLSESIRLYLERKMVYRENKNTNSS